VRYVPLSGALGGTHCLLGTACEGARGSQVASLHRMFPLSQQLRSRAPEMTGALVGTVREMTVDTFTHKEVNVRCVLIVEHAITDVRGLDQTSSEAKPAQGRLRLEKTTLSEP